MHVKNYLFLLLIVIKAIFGMEDIYNPQEVICITSFFYSVMAGNCVADNNIIEFVDYQDATLRHQIKFCSAQTLLERYSTTASTSREPIAEILQLMCDPKKPRKADLEFLKQDLTLQEAKEIQLYYFYKLSEKSKIRSMHTMYLKSFSDALCAICHGFQMNFNVAMQTIKKSGQVVPNPAQRIENLAAGS